MVKGLFLDSLKIIYNIKFVDSKKGEGRKKPLFSKRKKRENKKMLCEVESLTVLPPQIYQIVRVTRGNGSDYSTK